MKVLRYIFALLVIALGTVTVSVAQCSGGPTYYRAQIILEQIKFEQTRVDKAQSRIDELHESLAAVRSAKKSIFQSIRSDEQELQHPPSKAEEEVRTPDEIRFEIEDYKEVFAGHLENEAFLNDKKVALERDLATSLGLIASLRKELQQLKDKLADLDK
jgi:chromosome segregation ATPase